MAALDPRVKDLSLLLMLLTGWEEDKRNAPGEKVFKSWTGYLFEVLNELEHEKSIYQYRNTRLLVLTEEGKRRALEVRNKYLRS